MLEIAIAIVVSVYIVCQMKVGYDFVRRNDKKRGELNALGNYVSDYQKSIDKYGR